MLDSKVQNMPILKYRHTIRKKHIWRKAKA